ncbi:formate/nitrite transporter family protein [Candidatus Epulonipiscium viviparus]|uniref:formate/nitrite transporter family protein n=1 Tax=Candidatus Epulonipiscium viviparus TaxID=420336 RepID=UPI00273807F9|nr:formate/nitrite transporter family protein [Candidatus Epulopiscium viviparus]
MADKNYLTSKEISAYTIEAGVAKVKRPFLEIFVMGILAGMYIAMGGLASSTAAHGIADPGLAKFVAGIVFPVGLMFVVINGADLFTGNCLVIMSVYEKKTTVMDLITNLSIVLLGNFVGAAFIALIEAFSGLLTMGDGQFLYYIFKTAYAKTTMSFMQAFLLGIMCNLFVCSGIVMIYAAKDIAGKVLAGFFSIFAFVVSASEHIVANMYYIPVALFAKAQPDLVDLALSAGVTAEKIEHVTWLNFIWYNGVPVLLGNILGGFIIGTLYYLTHYVFAKKVQ